VTGAAVDDPKRTLDPNEMYNGRAEGAESAKRQAFECYTEPFHDILIDIRNQREICPWSMIHQQTE
jgi:hypothetical protein